MNCSINQKTHNNMSINVFPLSHQAGTIWRHACSSHTCFSAKGASLQSCSPSCFCRAIKIGDNYDTSYDVEHIAAYLVHC